MPRLLVVVAIFALVGEIPSSSPVRSEARAQEIIRELKLQVLPKESGYLGIIGRSAQIVTVSERPLAVQSQNYCMLTRDRPINYLHWLAPDDTHTLIEGGPVDYFIFHPDRRVEKVTLGMNLAAGERPVVAIPGGCWKALRLHDGVKYALMVNTLSPEFTPDRVKIGAGGGLGEAERWIGSMGYARGIARDDRAELGALNPYSAAAGPLSRKNHPCYSSAHVAGQSEDFPAGRGNAWRIAGRDAS